jgi:zinc D-Ala-D-Ala carboxypeptidase
MVFRKFLQRITLGEELVVLTFIVAFSVIGVISWQGYHRLTALSNQVSDLQGELDYTVALLDTASTTLAAQARTIEDQLGDVKSRVGSIDDSIDDLEKLSKTDPELLAKYSKVFFLSDTYAPARLVPIPAEYKYTEAEPLQIIPEVLPFLKRLMDRAKRDGIELYVDSAYRSFRTQQALKNQYVVTYGAGTANQFSAEQGYSEHQLGTTVDFITTGLGGSLTGFEKTIAYKWLLDNAHNYGFTLSYPQNNGYYVFEPWHWRFVGEELAEDLHDANKYFYELDQRKIDTYLIRLFD